MMFLVFYYYDLIQTKSILNLSRIWGKSGERRVFSFKDQQWEKWTINSEVNEKF